MEYQELLQQLEHYQSEMTPAERAAAYAKGQEVDHLPFSLLGSDPLMAEIFGYTTSQMEDDFEVMKAVIQKKEMDFGIAGISVGLGLRTVGHALGSKLLIPKHGIDYVKEYILQDYAKLGQLAVTDPLNNEVLTPLLELAKRLKEAFPNWQITTGVAGPVSTAAALRPVEQLLRDTRRNPDNLRQLLDLTVDCSLRWVEIFCREFGPAGVGFSDPVTCMDVLSKKQFDEFSLPYIKRLINGIKEITGSLPGAHICGKTKPIWSDLADAGLASFSIDNCEDLAEAKRTVGNRMALSGNVAPVEVLKEGTIDEVIEACKICILKGADIPGGFTLDAGCQVPLGTPRRNIEAFVYAVRKYGRGAKKGVLPKGVQDES